MSQRSRQPSPDELNLIRPRRRAIISRRGFLKLLAGAGTAAVLGGGYSWRVEPHWIQVVRRDLPIAHLPDAMADRTLAVIADLHVGPVVDDDYIRGAMDRVNELRPDMIAIVGDFMSCRRDEQVDHAIEVVSRLNAPPMGVFAVLGNHDYGRGWGSPSTADALVERLRGELGFRVLRNELAWVERLQVIGLDDLWANDPAAGGGLSQSGDRQGHRERPASAGNGWARGPSRPSEDSEEGGAVLLSKSGRFFDPEAVLPIVDADSPAIVLVHNPDAADTGDWADYRGWILCGHTHGGQVDMPLFGPPILPVSNKRYVAGEVDLGDGRRLYINRGLGYLRRVRMFCRPEITLFTLQPAAEEGPQARSAAAGAT